MILDIVKISAVLFTASAVIDVVTSRTIMENLLDEYFDPLENFESVGELPRSNSFSRLVAKRDIGTPEKSTDNDTYWNSGGIGSNDRYNKEKGPSNNEDAGKLSRNVVTSSNTGDSTSQGGIWRVKSHRDSAKIGADKKPTDNKISTTPKSSTQKSNSQSSKDIASSDDQMRSFSIKQKMDSFVQKWSSWKTYETDDMLGNQYYDFFFST